MSKGKKRLILLLGTVLAWMSPAQSQEEADFIFALDGRTSQIFSIDLVSGEAGTPFLSPVRCRPEGACGLAFSGSSLFMVDATDIDQQIYEINPVDGTIWNSIPTPSLSVDALSFDSGVLYALSFDEERIYALDPYDGRVINAIEVEEDLIGGLAIKDGRMFASRIFPAPGIFEIDPGSGTILRTFADFVQPSGLAFGRDRLWVGDPESKKLLQLDIETGEVSEGPPLELNELVALSSGAEPRPSEYGLYLEEIDQRQLADGNIEFTLRAGIEDGNGRLLYTNDYSDVVFSLLEGEGTFTQERYQVEAGEATALLTVPIGAAVRVKAGISGLRSAELKLGAVARTAEIEVNLDRDEEDPALVVVTARLKDFFGEPATEDTAEVVFSVVRGGGVLIGPALVQAEQAEARTLVRLSRRETELGLSVRVRTVEGKGGLNVTLDEPLTPSRQTNLVVSEYRSAGRDNLPPSPPTDVRAYYANGRVEVCWRLPEEYNRRSRFYFNDQLVERPLLEGFRIFRSADGGVFEEIGEAGRADTCFVDSVGTVSQELRYKVLSEDWDNLIELTILPGTPEDRARTVSPEPTLPVDAEGRPVLGLFGDDLLVSFDDFFIFADFFGTQWGDPGFEARFDLSGDGTVDFDDFFIFADNFGRVAVSR